MQALLKLNLAVSVVVLAILSYLFYTHHVAHRVGGSDSDEHGCCKSCGFSWCEAKRKCVRPWEEPASSPCAA